MLIELIEEYGLRYVDITIKTTDPRWPKNSWHASVKPFKGYADSAQMPTFYFETEGLTSFDLADNLRRTLGLYEPVIAHRERYQKAKSQEKAERMAHIKANPVVVTEDGKVHPNMGAH